MPDILVPGLATITLQSYHTDMQRLVHDSTYRFYSSDEVTDYANKARRRVAAETRCNAQIVPGYSLDQTVNSFDVRTLPLPGYRIIGVLDVYFWQSDTIRLPLAYYPYSTFARLPMVLYQYQDIPRVWSQRGGIVYLAPKLNQAYNFDLDVSVEPKDLADLTDPDNDIFSPFSECVKFYMAHLAYLSAQKFDEANLHLQYYVAERNRCLAGTIIRKLVGR